MTWSVQWGVTVDGQDLTAEWRKLLIDISVTDKAGTASDSCNLTIDDTGGQIRMPSKRAPIAVTIDGVRIFGGFVEKVQSSGSRSSGRLLKVTAKGFDSGGKAKEGQSFHLDDATLGDYLARLADGAGLRISVDPELAALTRDYWSADGESLIAIGQGLAQRFGATFKIRGNQAVFAKRGEAQSASGQQLGITDAAWGENLMEWDITPKDPRRSYSSGRAQWFDRDQAAFRHRDLDFGEGAKVTHKLRSIAADEDDADSLLDARKRESKRESGSGSVKLDLTLGAVVEGQCRVSGTRPGIDGVYVIDIVKHSANRSGGAVTDLTLKQPGGGAGEDDR